MVKIDIKQDWEGKTVIGTTGQKIITTNDDAKHIFICGTTGSGKTVLLSNYIESGINKNYPMLINPLIYPELSPLIGRLILIDAKKAVSKMYTNNEKRIFFIFDEINVYASPTLIDLINKSRSANITCIPATQSLADLEYAAGEAFKQQLIENCNNFIVMRQNSAKSAEEWAKILGTRQALEITYQLENKNNVSNSTGYGTAKRVRQFHYHPDDIKELKTGVAIFLSKDTATHSKVNVRKGF